MSNNTNNHSNGNNCSNGNNWSMFLFNCKGNHKSILCKDKRGINYMVLNQQLSKENSKDFYINIIELFENWLPFVTNYCELKDKGWHQKWEESNKYVFEEIKDDDNFFLKQYHYAWSKFKKKKELIDLIKSTPYLKTDSALQTLKEITGIGVEEQEKLELTLDEVAEKFGVNVNNLKIKK